ncbi:MAG: hypothetical protein V2J55_05710 [Candidatus Competibacteraceae bacterium]|jgi:hypothetical protein|nr:hypothetical protein [Candidatus Competibacteraceae bacterium]
MMADNTVQPITLNLIPGGRCIDFWVKQVQLVARPAEHPPFATEAVVLEEDTYLVLSAEAVVRQTDEHPIRLMTALFDQQPLEPGCVVVRGNRLLAVIHDLDRDPTCCEQWVSQALQACLKQADQLGVRSLTLPLLGSVHGRIPYSRCLVLIVEAVEEATFHALRRVWLVVPETQQMGVEQFLRLRAVTGSR